ncbi:hypothetical protein ACIQZB_40615 [Streptomyces sp. NPDC097727]|uniref:hypothetical protein n=1 Tax=Streptomyces sp. NPDC097727 TaxID=3366092 RepID=UPI0037F5CF6C
MSPTSDVYASTEQSQPVDTATVSAPAEWPDSAQVWSWSASVVLYGYGPGAGAFL